jgi:exo-1,4-beta-D-glucosaminidase
MEILPVLWDDNYFELMPGESRDIAAEFLSPGALDGQPELSVTGWNVEPVTLSLRDAENAAGPSGAGR